MDRKTNLAIFFIFVLLSLIFYYPIFLGKVPFNGNLLVSFWSPWKYLNLYAPFKFLAVDEIREFFPLLDFTYERLRLGELPLWNPYNFSGYAHFANWASTIFYPLHLSIFLLSKIHFFIFLKISSIFLSGFFVYLYLTSLGLDKRSSFFGGVTFGLSSTFIIWGSEIWQSVHSFLWLPLILFSVEKYILKKKFFYILIGSLSLTLSLMGGYIQPTIYIYLFVLTYIIFKIFNGEKNFIRSLLPFFVMFFLSFAFSAVHLFPSVESFLLSPRRGISLTDLNLSFLLSPEHILTFFVPDIFGHISTQNWFIKRPGQYYEQMIYIGVVPLILTSLSFYLKKTKPLALFFFFWIIFSLSSIFDLPTSRFIYYLNIPFLSTAIPIRIIFVTTFSFSILSSFGLSFWFSSKDKRKTFFSLLPLIFVYSIIGLFLIFSFFNKVKIDNFPQNWFMISIRNFILPGFIFLTMTILLILGVYIPKIKKDLYFLILFILILHSFIFAQKYLTFSKKEFIYPSHPFISYIKENAGLSRFWGYADAAFINNFATVYQIYSPEGYDPVNIKYYNELLSSANTGDYRGVASRSDALIPNTDIFPLDDKNQYRLKLLDLLGVKYVGYYNNSQESIKKENDRYILVFQKDNFIIFKNKKVLERAFLVSDWEYFSSKEDIIKNIYSPKIDLSKKVILEEKIDLEKNKNSEGKVEITSYTPNKIEIKTRSNNPQLLVLSDAYYPGWEAKVNDSRTKIYKADYALRAVLIPKGESKIVFNYNPKSFYFGLIISICSFLLVIFYLISKLKKDFQK